MKYLLVLLLALSWVAGCGEGKARSHIHTGEVTDAGMDATDTPSLDAEGDGGSQDVFVPDGSAADSAQPDADEPDARGEPDSTDEEDTFVEPDTRAEPDTQAEPDIQEPAPGPFILWMAPDGVDSRDGRSQAQAVLTMNRVHQILQASAPQTDVEVRIAPGRYRAQKVNWTFSVPGHTVTFTRLAGRDDRPVFDGCVSANNCPGGTWFKLSRSDGAETRLVFHYLRIENYQTAISLNGSRNAEASSNGSNRIFGCYFYRIGNVFNSALDPSTAAIRLVNSDDNEIINNHFVDIINTRSPALLHAIYIAHMSDRNQILRNRFYNNAGGPIRVRDYSNDNIINDNTFKKVSITAAYGEWYCDHDTRNDCTKATPECPSWGNQFRDNHLNGTYACGPLRTFIYYQDDSASGCSPPSSGARRLRTSGITHASTPCE